MDILTQLQALDRATVTRIVRDALRRDSATIDAWHAELLYAPGAVFNPSNGGVYRVAGTARDADTSVPWSLIVKVLRSPAGMPLPDGEVFPPDLAEDPTLFNYWKREALAYTAGLLDDLPGGLATPRCFGSIERPGPSAWLWLEDVTQAADAVWPPARYGLAAHHLGAFNGAYLTTRQLPTAPWLSRHWLRSWVAVPITQLMAYLEDHGAWDHPTIQAACPAPAPARLRQLWRDREAFLAALERLPQALCHLDAFRSNLIARQNAGREETVALDWAFVGPAAVGEELSALVVASLLRGAVPLADAVALEEAAFEGYLAGLREAGWTGNPRAVRLGYVASAPLRYGLVALMDLLRSVIDAGHAATLEREEGRPFQEIVAQRGALVAFLLDRVDEARELLPVA